MVRLETKTQNSMPLTLTEVALARSHSYTLFGRLFLDGITAELLPFLAGLPQLARHLPQPFVADEMAALHYDLFHFQIFPYEAVFLDKAGLMGGEFAGQVQQTYQQVGWIPPNGASTPDHIGYQLHLMAFLCQAEAQHHPTQGQQAHFLHRHLLRWLAPFVMAVHETAVPFYTHLADLTLNLVLDHTQTLPTPPNIPPFHLPAPPDLLENERTSLKEIATYLVTPALSGLFISRGEIGRLARACQLPYGFGSRADMLTDLFQAAGPYNSLPILFERLQNLLEKWDVFYTNWQETTETAVWRTRLHHTHHLIQQMSQSSMGL